MRTRSPRISRSAPKDAAVSPLPNEETTPPVTKIYFTGFHEWRAAIVMQAKADRLACARSPLAEEPAKGHQDRQEHHASNH